MKITKSQLKQIIKEESEAARAQREAGEEGTGEREELVSAAGAGELPWAGAWQPDPDEMGDVRTTVPSGMTIQGVPGGEAEWAERSADLGSDIPAELRPSARAPIDPSKTGLVGPEQEADIAHGDIDLAKGLKAKIKKAKAEKNAAWTAMKDKATAEGLSSWKKLDKKSPERRRARRAYAKLRGLQKRLRRPAKRSVTGPSAAGAVNVGSRPRVPEAPLREGKITKRQLKRIIQEEIENVLAEGPYADEQKKKREIAKRRAQLHKSAEEYKTAPPSAGWPDKALTKDVPGAAEELWRRTKEDLGYEGGEVTGEDPMGASLRRLGLPGRSQRTGEEWGKQIADLEAKQERARSAGEMAGLSPSLETGKTGWDVEDPMGRREVEGIEDWPDDWGALEGSEGDYGMGASHYGEGIPREMRADIGPGAQVGAPGELAAMAGRRWTDPDDPESLSTVEDEKGEFQGATGTESFADVTAKDKDFFKGKDIDARRAAARRERARRKGKKDFDLDKYIDQGMESMSGGDSKWVGLSHSEVKQKLKSEHGIDYSKNWYLPRSRGGLGLSYGHPARKAYRKWYKNR